MIHAFLGLAIGDFVSYLYFVFTLHVHNPTFGFSSASNSYFMPSSFSFQSERHDSSYTNILNKINYILKLNIPVSTLLHVYYISKQLFLLVLIASIFQIMLSIIYEYELL